jgi:PAS domain S-box-containing protein
MTKDPPVHARVNLTANASDAPANRPSSPRSSPRSSQRRAPQERGRFSAPTRLPEQKAEASQFRALIELAPDAILAVDDLGQISLANRQTELMFGYAREELLGQPIETLIPERFRAIHPHQRERYTAEPRTRPMGLDLPLLGRRRDGSEFPVEVGLSPLEGEGAFAVVAIVRDITERRRVEAERASAEAANQELRKVQAITDSALRKVTSEELLPALLDRIRQVMAVDNAAILLAHRGEQTLTLSTAQGVEESLTGQVSIPFGEGIAGRIAATQAPVIVDDLREVGVANPLLREQFRSLVGVPLLVDGELIGVLHVDSVIERRFTDTDVRLLQLVGERVAHLIDRARLYTEEQAARRQAEAARVDELAAREISQRLDEFLSVASHDIRAPVAAITGNTQQALHDFDRLLEQGSLSTLDADLAAVRESLAEAVVGSDRLARLVEVLFDIVRARTGNLDLQVRECDLASLLRTCVAAQRMTAPARDIRLEVSEEQPILVNADPERLGQVLSNYLTNALKYSRDASVVVVRLEVTGGLAVVSVEDAGPGLPWEEQSRVWNLFYRAPGVNVQSATVTAGSLGLGLHVCKQIIELHHGRVGIESMEGQGATFWFSLPLATETP